MAHPQDDELKNLVETWPEAQLVYQTERKGAAHALSMAAPLIQDNFLLTACDNLVNEDELASFVDHFKTLRSQRSAGLLALMHVSPEKIPGMGMVDWDGQIIHRIVEKPSAAEIISDVGSMPLYCLPHRFLDYLPRLTPSKRGEFELQDAMQLMISETDDMHGKMLSGRWTVTDARDLLELNMRFLGKDTQIPQQGFPASAIMTAPYLVEAGVEIGAGCSIGPRVVIEAPAKIGRGAILRNALVMRGSEVPAGEIVENRVLG